MKNLIFKIDYNIAELFHKIYLWGGNFTNTLMKGISLLAEMGLLFLLIGFVFILFKKTRKVGGAILISVVIGFLITNVILKNSVERMRPFENGSSSYFKWWLSAGAEFEDGFSFPSGHTTATTAFSLAIFLTTNKNKSWPILFFPVIMASSRVYLMVHYFSDCLGAFAVGTVSSIIAYLIIKWIYVSKLKLFVWARDFSLFKFEKKKVVEAPIIKEEVKEESYTYLTQQQEKETAKTESTHQESDSKKDNPNEE